MIDVDDATLVALRRAGWTIEQIVTETGANPGAVARALGARGTSPATWTLPTLSRAVTWSEQRRAGQRVTQIAARAGVSHQWVSRLTRPFGPFPPANHPVREWVQARHAGQSIKAIAQQDKVSEHRVSTATRPYGPFPYPHRDTGDRIHTAGIARMMGVLPAMVTRWRTRPDFPSPVSQSGPAPREWDRAAVQAWADHHLSTCPVCTARVLDVPRHRGNRRH